MDHKMLPTSNLPTPTDDLDRKLLADIKEYGWHVIAVTEDEEGPAFAYSIALFHSLQHPEIIAFGLDVRLMHEMINRIGEQTKSGKRFGHLDEADDILDGYKVQFRSVEKKHSFRDMSHPEGQFFGSSLCSAVSCVSGSCRPGLPANTLS